MLGSDPGKIVDDFSAAVRKVLPENLARDAEKNLRAALAAVFERLDLVTREQLEVQGQVLERTRARLGEIEKKIAELEEKLKTK